MWELSQNKGRIHFIGIGGIGMSGLAEILLARGYDVSGSDKELTSLTNKLSNLGAKIFKGHEASQAEGASVVVYSSAVNSKNPEWMTAEKNNIPLIKRAQMLSELMKGHRGLAVAGSHGKTTTTSLLATIFDQTSKKASHMIGGVVLALGGNARHRESDIFIAEADESDGSFHLLSPENGVITNIDNDHLDFYGSQEAIVESFRTFVENLPLYGKIIFNADDECSFKLGKNLTRDVIWVSQNLSKPNIHYYAQNIKFSASGTSFELFYLGVSQGKLKTHLIGEHNVSNALCAIALAHVSGASWTEIKRGLDAFVGVGRRLEKLFSNNEFLVLDDYGHHPTEIKATISALKNVDKRKLCVVFEPHRFSRTKNFWEEFQGAFTGADEVFISPIYGASEEEIEGISSEELVRVMQLKKIPVTYLESLDSMKDLLKERSDKACILLTLGAGAISKRAREMVKNL